MRNLVFVSLYSLNKGSSPVELSKMVVLRPQSDFGHAPPPQTPYSIVTNLPGWGMLQGFRDGDMSAMARVVHIYPRFGPTHFAAKVSYAANIADSWQSPLTLPVCSLAKRLRRE